MDRSAQDESLGDVPDFDDFEVLDGADFDDSETLGDPPTVHDEPARHVARASHSLGDAGADNSDLSYEGEQSTSPLSMDYFRAKFLEFQVTLNSLDTAYRAALNVLAIPGVNPEVAQGLRAAVADYESRRATLKRTAETMNMGAALANNLGGRMPVLSIPQTLGLPFVVPIAIAGGVAAAASLVVWGNGLIQVFKTHLLRAQAMAQLSPEGRASLATELAKIDAAQNASTGTGLSSVAGAVKWIAVGAIAYFAWKAFSDSRGGRGD